MTKISIDASAISASTNKYYNWHYLKWRALFFFSFANKCIKKIIIKRKGQTWTIAPRRRTSSISSVRLNLFNHVLGLFHAKFACNLAIRYPVFRWELCKGSVWESAKKSQEVRNSRESRDWILRLAHDWQVARMTQVWSMHGQLKGHASWSTIRQNFQFG